MKTVTFCKTEFYSASEPDALWIFLPNVTSVIKQANCLKATMLLSTQIPIDKKYPPNNILLVLLQFGDLFHSRKISKGNWKHY